MNLNEIREQFVRLCGRYDLVEDTTNWKNSSTGLGADFFIQSGQDFLDLRIDTTATPAVYRGFLESGDYTFTLRKAKNISNVFVNDGEDEVELLRKDRLWLREQYPKPYADIDTGTPLYYSLLYTREAHKPVTGEDTIRKIIIMPPADGDYTIEVEGRFYSEPLQSDEDISFWSANYPWMLIWASMYMLETFYRNQTGASEWLANIERTAVQMDHQRVKDEMEDMTEMKQYFPEVNE